MSLLAYFIASALLLAFSLYLFYPWYKIRGVRGKTAPSLEGIPGIKPEQTQDILLYFMSPQCSMCKSTTPIIDELAKSRQDVVRIDTAEHPDIAHRFSILGTPAFVQLKQGKIEKVKLGALSRAKILALLDTE